MIILYAIIGLILFFGTAFLAEYISTKLEEKGIVDFEDSLIPLAVSLYIIEIAVIIQIFYT